MNDEEELDYGGHNGGWRPTYPWWDRRWRGQPWPRVIPVAVAQPAPQALAYRGGEQVTCPPGYYGDGDGLCHPVAQVASSGVLVGAVSAVLVGLAGYGLIRLIAR